MHSSPAGPGGPGGPAGPVSPLGPVATLMVTVFCGVSWLAEATAKAARLPAMTSSSGPMNIVSLLIEPPHLQLVQLLSKSFGLGPRFPQALDAFLLSLSSLLTAGPTI